MTPLARTREILSNGNPLQSALRDSNLNFGNLKIDRPTVADNVILKRVACYVPRMIIVHLLRCLEESRSHKKAICDSVETPRRRLLNKIGLTNTKITLTPAIYPYKGAALLIADISGFTRLNETFSNLGSGGAEQVSIHLNHYFTQILSIIKSHGGDCVKFAGDALIVIFSNECIDYLDQPGENHLKTSTSRRAVQCGMDLQKEVGLYECNSVTLTLHIAVGAGDIYAMYVGGVNDEWELLVTGSPFSQIAEALDMSKKGQVVVSKHTWALVKPYCSGKVVNPDSETGEMLIRKVRYVHPPFFVSDPPLPQQIAPYLLSYVPTCIMDRITEGEEQFLGENRVATVVFVNLIGLKLDDEFSHDTTKPQEVLTRMQRILSKNRGYRRQFLVDDKGSTFICVFGIPPFTGDNDAYRGVKTSLEFHKSLEMINVAHSIGIASGNVYVGSVGSTKRKEHAVVGDTVNTSARLSGKAKKYDGNVLCDAPTYEKCYMRCRMIPKGDIKVKGKDKYVNIYSPVQVKKMKWRKANNTLSGTGVIGGAIGRDKETALFMKTLIQWSQTGDGHGVSVEGESGVGKSHLLQNFHQMCSLSGVKCVHGRAHGSERNTPFYIWRVLLEQLLDFQSIQQLSFSSGSRDSNGNSRTSGEINKSASSPSLSADNTSSPKTNPLASPITNEILLSPVISQSNTKPVSKAKKNTRSREKKSQKKGSCWNAAC